MTYKAIAKLLRLLMTVRATRSNFP